MKFLRTLLLAAPLAGAARLDRRGKVSYDGYKIFRVAPEFADAVETELEDLSGMHLMRTAQHFDVAIPPESIESFQLLNVSSELISDDIGAEIALEGELAPYESLVQALDVAAAAVPDASWFRAYHSYNDHLTFLSDLQKSFPSNSEIFRAGTSFQGRAITGIHLWGSGGKGSKPAITFHGTVHAREWITTMVNEYIAWQLVVGYGNDTTVKAYLDSYDFYILPVVNPDGFVYTQTTNRLWRKNRQTRSGISAVGTDVNRNWPYQWSGPGSSTSPSSETYRGQSSGDAPENLGLRTHLDNVARSQGLKLYIDWHSYSQLILLPYGYSCSARAENINQQMTLARGVASAIARPYGTRFEYGPTCSTIYQTNGGSNDYAQDVSGAEFAWAFELRDTGRNGFVLPPEQIIPSGFEAWEGIKNLLNNF
ncbi:hypothetical protein DL764_005305 [Monosporascus ibericus]|uniref:Peptidase M14 domain-containing protein n=1 Tax=Monosporascus ibericus TaxID=155417 RepID=A0A4Q4T9C9_9PEZI|nr:hypothetical protein DL764_005305 [Monosporascus ibericus]